jgi:hypothetical protein
VDQEVAKTLGELELKLQQLEHELTSIGHQDTAATQAHATQPQIGLQQGTQTQTGASPDAHSQAAPSHGTQPHTQPQTPGRLVDESVEPSTSEQALADADAFGGPAVFGGEEIPSQASATIEHDWTVDVRETAYGEIPTLSAPPSEPMPGPPLPPPMPTPQPPPAAPPGQPPAETPPGPPPPQTPPGPEPIDRADLVRFKHKLERTMGELLDEYTKLLSPKPPT